MDFYLYLFVYSYNGRQLQGTLQLHTKIHLMLLYGLCEVETREGLRVPWQLSVACIMKNVMTTLFMGLKEALLNSHYN